MLWILHLNLDYPPPAQQHCYTNRHHPGQRTGTRTPCYDTSHCNIGYVDGLKSKAMGVVRVTVTLTVIDICVWDCIPKDYTTDLSFIRPRDNEKPIAAFRGMSL